MSRLADAGRTVLLETSGAVDIGAGRPARPHHPRPEDARLGRGRGERLGQPRPPPAQGRGQVRPLRPGRFRLGRGASACPSADRPLPRAVQPRLRSGQPDRPGRLGARLRTARPAPGPASQNSLGPEGAWRLNLSDRSDIMTCGGAVYVGRRPLSVLPLIWIFPGAAAGLLTREFPRKPTSLHGGQPGKIPTTDENSRKVIEGGPTAVPRGQIHFAAPERDE